MEFQNWLREQLEERGWSQRQLAQKGELDPAMVSRVLSGDRSATLDFCKGVASAFKLPPEVVLQYAGLIGGGYAGVSMEDPRLAEINHLLAGLPENDRAEVIEYVRMKVKIAEKRGDYHVSEPNPST